MGRSCYYSEITIESETEDGRRRLKPLFWVGSSLKDLRSFPEEVKDAIGYALEVAQRGEKAGSAKPLKGFGGASALEIVADHDGNTWRAVYTVELAGIIYVLHAFQKKSKKGIATPKQELDLIKRRLEAAREHERGKKDD
jgi:phage-related protein